MSEETGDNNKKEFLPADENAPVRTGEILS